MMSSGNKKEEIEVPTPTLPEAKGGTKAAKGKRKTPSRKAK